MKRPEIQQILDWRLAKGLRFAQVDIADLAPCSPNRVWRLRSRLGYCSAFRHTFTTLGQAVVMLALLRAGYSPPKHSLSVLAHLTEYLDEPNTPFPLFVALTLDAPSEYWVGDSGSELFAKIGRIDQAMLMLIVPSLIEALCNGEPAVYAASHAQVTKA